MGRRKTIGRGHDSKHGKSHWYIRVNGAKTWFPTRKDRDAAYNNKLSEAQKFGFDHVDLSREDRLTIAEMQRKAAAAGAHVMEIFRAGLEHVGHGPPMPVSEAVGLYLAHCKARVIDGTMRKPTERNLRHILGRFAAHAGTMPINSITNELVHEWAGQGKAANTRANLVSRVSMMFGWLVATRRIAANPCRRPRVPRTIPAVYDARRVAQIMGVAERLHPEIVAMLALQWFAGIRPSASQGLLWESIDFARRRIVIPPHLSKSREVEIVGALPDAVWAWLRKYRQPSGRIVPFKHQWRYHGVKTACGISQWPADVARHSFASHLYGLTGSIDGVARALLHHTTRITLRHYVAFGIKRSAAKQYFSIRPSARRPARRARSPRLPAAAYSSALRRSVGGRPRTSTPPTPPA